MELIVFMTVLCFTFFALQTPCSSLLIKEQSSNEQGVQLSHPTLPRKLRFTEEAVAFKGNEAHHSTSITKQKQYVSGKAYQKEQDNAWKWRHKARVDGVWGRHFTIFYNGLFAHKKTTPHT